ncbi:hypothetical protein CKQ90_33910, partial [Klebsiella pneumoniae]
PSACHRRCLERAGWRLDDVDLIEANEAFAAQAIRAFASVGVDPALMGIAPVHATVAVWSGPAGGWTTSI